MGVHLVRRRQVGFSFDAPVLAGVDLQALILSTTAIIAMFRFKTGVIRTLAACSAAGSCFASRGVLMISVSHFLLALGTMMPAAVWAQTIAFANSPVGTLPGENLLRRVAFAHVAC
jgi:hypothetical protein